MKYVALLRGINVGGNAIIKMVDLKKATERCGFTNVSTYIQSGNLFFESADTAVDRVTEILEGCLARDLGYGSRIIVRTHEQLKGVVSSVPHEWEEGKDLRCYIAFVGEPATVEDVVREIQPKEGVDFVAVGPGVVYMSTLLSGLTKSGFTRLVGKGVYKDITMRNYSTVKKLLALMETKQPRK